MVEHEAHEPADAERLRRMAGWEGASALSDLIRRACAFWHARERFELRLVRVEIRGLAAAQEVRAGSPVPVFEEGRRRRCEQPRQRNCPEEPQLLLAQQAQAALVSGAAREESEDASDKRDDQVTTDNKRAKLKGRNARIHCHRKVVVVPVWLLNLADESRSQVRSNIEADATNSQENFSPKGFA